MEKLKISLNRTSIEFVVSLNGSEQTFKYLEATTEQMLNNGDIDSVDVKKQIEGVKKLLKENITHADATKVDELIAQVSKSTSLFSFRNQLDIAIAKERDEAIKKSLNT